jgi:hypothetical protein
MDKSFLLLFFKKEVLAFFCPNLPRVFPPESPRVVSQIINVISIRYCSAILPMAAPHQRQYFAVVPIGAPPPRPVQTKRSSAEEWSPRNVGATAMRQTGSACFQR